MATSIGTEFMKYYNQQRLRALIGIDDWSDRLNYFYTVSVLSVCITIVTVKTYFLNPLACHCPTIPAGSKFSSFLMETCFTQGTIAMRANESLPQVDEDWKLITEERRRNYYYWVPFMLGLQLILFYLPDLIWRSLTYNKLGTNLQTLIQEANKAREATSVKDRKKYTQQVAEAMHLVLFAHRNVKRGLITDLKRSCSKVFGFLIISKRLGTWTVASYFIIKLLYLANAIGQLFLMRHFLGFDAKGIHAFGLEMARRLRLKDDWRESLYFPRTAFCRVDIRLLGSQNSYVALCALPVNLFNEKIYVFLWFWVMFVAVCTACSIPVWLLHLGSEKSRIRNLRRYFRIEKLPMDEKNQTMNPYKKSPLNKNDLKQFISEFLRYDGLFILEIISNHVGDVVTGEITRLLWSVWVQDYAERHDFGCDDWESVNDRSHFGDEASLSTPQTSLVYPASGTLKKRGGPPPQNNRNGPSSVKSGHF